MNRATPVIGCLCLALGACQPATLPVATDDAAVSLRPLPGQAASSAASLGSRSADLLPYIREAHFQIRDDYVNAVALLDDLRGRTEFARQYELLEAYALTLTDDLERLRGFEAVARSRTLTPAERIEYHTLVSTWRERSTIVYRALGRSE